jgi:hypothetical protein
LQEHRYHFQMTTRTSEEKWGLSPLKQEIT